MHNTLFKLVASTATFTVVLDHTCRALQRSVSGNSIFITFDVSLDIFIIIVFWAIRDFKINNNGYISLSEALKTGVGTSLISALILSIYTIILIQYLDPIENVNKMFDMQKEFSGPFIISGFIIIFNLFFGFIISLIVGLILKKSQPE